MPSARDRPPPGVSGARAALLEGAAIVAFVATTDLDRAHAFYGGVLGLSRTEASPFANAYDGGGGSLRVTRVEHLVPAKHTVLGWRVEALGGTLARLARAGIRTRRFAGLDQDADGVWTAPGGARIAWFEDPDGNLLSLTEFPPSAPPTDPAGATARGGPLPGEAASALGARKPSPAASHAQPGDA
jgi:catechol 2,3-dioxygenase-like lactoylglutathione lyase family enzyme